MPSGVGKTRSIPGLLVPLYTCPPWWRGTYTLSGSTAMQNENYLAMDVLSILSHNTWI